MKQKNQTLVIIGARSKSKSIKDKNLLIFDGKTLLQRIIETAISAKGVDRVIVSTDSKKYAKIAINAGAECPFIRPTEISKDTSGEFEYVKHAINFLKKKENYTPSYILRLQATVPFQNKDDIESALSILKSNANIDTVMVISEARQNPYKALKIIDHKLYGKCLVDFTTGKAKFASPFNRQSKEKAYFRSNIIGCKFNVIKKYNSMVGSVIKYHEIPQERSIDIDSKFDFYVAKMLLKFLK